MRDTRFPMRVAWRPLLQHEHICSRRAGQGICIGRHLFWMRWHIARAEQLEPEGTYIRQVLAQHPMWQSVGGPGRVVAFGDIAPSGQGYEIDLVVCCQHAVSHIALGLSLDLAFSSIVGLADVGFSHLRVTPFPCMQSAVLREILKSKWNGYLASSLRRCTQFVTWSGEIE